MEEVPGFAAPVHRALTEHILLGGAPRAVAILNGTLAAALGLGLRLWLAGLLLGVLGQAAAVWAAKRDPQFVDVVRRHLRIPGRRQTCRDSSGPLGQPPSPSRDAANRRSPARTHGRDPPDDRPPKPARHPRSRRRLMVFMILPLMILLNSFEESWGKNHGLQNPARLCLRPEKNTQRHSSARIHFWMSEGQRGLAFQVVVSQNLLTLANCRCDRLHRPRVGGAKTDQLPSQPQTKQALHRPCVGGSNDWLAGQSPSHRHGVGGDGALGRMLR